MSKRRTRFAYLAWSVLLASLGGADRKAQEAPVEDPLVRFGLHETTGAAAGYVEDRACRLCHVDLFESYQSVSMAKSFFRPRADRVIEDFEDNHYFHEASGRHYEMRRDGEGYLFSRWEEDAAGSPINVFEKRVDWILGSGVRSRTYLYSTPGGELYQLPLAWYAESDSWRMAPGFEGADHQGVLRRVRRECMFCHNAYPEVPVGSDLYGSSQNYPRDLPEGIGCQRCHGPGAEHVRVGMSEPVDFPRLVRSIVNPAKLSPQRRDDICYECHLQPTVALFGVRRFGRSDYSFRPGEALNEYMVPVDVEVEGEAREDRFEINHHPYRLRQSRCYQESQGAMSCMTCHDPHRKVAVEERVGHYKQACQSCHEPDDCQLDAMTAEASLPESLRAVAAEDCVACHMPRRRSSDVIEVTVTDHRIRRQPIGTELVAPLPATDPMIVDVEILPLAQAPTGDVADLYRAVSVARAGGSSSLDTLEKLLLKLKVQAPEPYLDLVRGRLQKHQREGLDRALAMLLTVQPQSAVGLEWKGLSRAQAGQREDAIALLERSISMRPERPEGWFNLGYLFLGEGRYREALEHLKESLSRRDNLPQGWYHKGNALALLGDHEAAQEAYLRSLELDPDAASTYVAVARTALKLDRREQARRYLLHGVKVSSKPEVVAAALEELEAMDREAEAPKAGGN